MTALVSRDKKADLQRFIVGARYGGTNDTDFKIFKVGKPMRDGKRWSVLIDAEFDPLDDYTEENGDTLG